MSHFENLLHFISRLQSATASLIHILLLQSVSIFLQSAKILLKFSAGIAKLDDYYNVR